MSILEEIFFVVRRNPDTSGTAKIFGIYENFDRANDNINEFNTDPATSGLYAVVSTVSTSGVLGSVSHFHAFSSSGLSINNDFVDIPLDIEVTNTGDFNHNTGSPEITVLTSGIYAIGSVANSNVLDGVNRLESESRIMFNTGNGFQELPGSRTKMYNRNRAKGENTGTYLGAKPLSSSTTLKLQMRRSKGLNSLTAASGTSLTLSNVQGPAGPTGSTGPAGTDGVTAPSGAFDAYDSNGDTVIGSTFTPIPLITERTKDPTFTHTASGAEVTVNETARYYVAAKISTDRIDGGGRTVIEVVIVRNGSEVPGTKAWITNQPTPIAGEGTVVIPFVDYLDVGDVLRVEAKRLIGGNKVISKKDGSSLILFKVP